MNRTLKILLPLVILGSFAGYAGVKFMPNKHTASGIFYISRTAQKESGDFFTYEGNYAEQTAASYTQTFLSILQSSEVKKSTLLEIKNTDQSNEIKRLSRQAKAKKEGPRAVSLKIKAGSSQQAVDLWKTYAKNAVNVSNTISAESDPLIKVWVDKNSPVLTSMETSPWLGALAGAVATVAVCVFLLLTNRLVKEMRYDS